MAGGGPERYARACAPRNRPDAGERSAGGVPAGRAERHRQTETALAPADALFGGEKALITINLSSTEPHTVSQLKGSPPAVGYGRGGILTEAVRKRPYSVVLLDEVEKAHRDVMNLFYGSSTGGNARRRGA